jgi:hypothetical protein
MMKVKLFEVRDRMTLVPAMAIQVSGADGWLMRRAGFESPMVYLVKLATEECKYDPYNWNCNTMRYAHHYIQEHFDELEDGQVIDAEFIRGERPAPRVSERAFCERVHSS